MDTVVKVFAALAVLVLLWAILGPALLALAVAAVVIGLAWESRAWLGSCAAYLADTFRRTK